MFKIHLITSRKFYSNSLILCLLQNKTLKKINKINNKIIINNNQKIQMKVKKIDIDLSKFFDYF